MAATAASSALSPAAFNDYNTALQGAALRATKHAVQLPTDIPFHRSIDRTFAKDIEACSSRVLGLTNRLLSLVSTAETSASARRKGKARLENEEDVVDSFHALIVDPMDQLLERADICLDEFLGRTKPPAIAVQPILPPTHKAKKTNVPQGRLDPALQHASHLAKPQLTFTRKADNSSHTIWKPTLRHKYNAQVPLGYIFRDQDGDQDLATSSTFHPYLYEIQHIPYPARMFTSSPPISPRSFADTPFTWVADPATFASMLDKLRSAQEIAVDLEYHSYRTYGGFVCLMQISTREEDWVVDALAVRDEMEALNEMFTDPRIVKVLHGAESDIVWLQQDFNLYIVNLFDTYHASKVLDFPRHGLATLLEMYCDFTADKRYQLADWRIRPLPEEMLAYARSDTHFLLYIYDNLRNALLDRAQSRVQSRAQSPSTSSTPPPGANPTHELVRLVLARSEETALRVYEKELYDAEGGSGPGGWDTLARKWNKGALMAGAPDAAGNGGSVYAVQRAVYRCAHAWRDRVAREEDESTRYVLPNHYLFVLAERPPADMAGLLSLFSPVPPVVRRRSKELLDAIRDAVRQALGAPTQAATIPAPAISALQISGHQQTGDGPKQTDDGVATNEAMQVDGGASLVPSAGMSGETAPVTSLWSRASRPASAALSSVLFGPTLVTHLDIKEAASAPYVAPQSALFGGKTSGLTISAGHGKARFREAVARIHSTLTITPSLPPLPSLTASVDASSPHAADDSTPTLDHPDAVEIPFVPAAERQSRQLPAGREPVDDTLVMVGQRARKRKRAPKGAAAAGADASAADGEKGGRAKSPSRTAEPAAVEPFDYSTVSNILDEGSEPEVEDAQSARKKKKQKAKGAAPYQYGDFGAPPKAHSQPKSGNVSHTFR